MGEPKCLRIYFRGVFRVSTLAEVNKFFSGFVYSKFSSIFRIFFDKFKFERLTFEDFFGLGRSYFFSAEIKFFGTPPCKKRGEGGWGFFYIFIFFSGPKNKFKKIPPPLFLFF